MKRKNSKKGGIIAAVIGLSAISLVSVGFASWIIGGTDSASLDGSIAVDTVEDHRFNILNKDALKASQSSRKVVFGHPANATSGWLTDTSSNVEALSFSMDVFVNNYNGPADDGVSAASLSASIALKDNAAAYTTAVSNNVVCAISDVSVVVGSRAKATSGDYSGKYYSTVTVTFAWGSAFNNQNPYTFYNSKDINGYVSGTSGDTWGDHALKYLGYVAALASTTYTVTLTTSAAA